MHATQRMPITILGAAILTMADCLFTNLLGIGARLTHAHDQAVSSLQECRSERDEVANMAGLEGNRKMRDSTSSLRADS